MYIKCGTTHRGMVISVSILIRYVLKKKVGFFKVWLNFIMLHYFFGHDKACAVQIRLYVKTFVIQVDSKICQITYQVLKKFRM